MTGLEPQVSGVGSDHSANCATTTVGNLLRFCRLQNAKAEMAKLQFSDLEYSFQNALIYLEFEYCAKASRTVVCKAKGL